MWNSYFLWPQYYRIFSLDTCCKNLKAAGFPSVVISENLVQISREEVFITKGENENRNGKLGRIKQIDWMWLMCVLETSGANVGGLMVNLALGLDDSGVTYLMNIDNSTNLVFPHKICLSRCKFWEGCFKG